MIHQVDRGRYYVGGWVAPVTRTDPVDRVTPGPDDLLRVRVAGARAPWFGLAAVDGDLWYNGPAGPAQGPHVAAYELPAAEPGWTVPVLDVTPGDMLRVDGCLWRLDFLRRPEGPDLHNVTLTLLGPG